MTAARELVTFCLGGSPFGSAAGGIVLIDDKVQLSHHDLAARVRAGAMSLTQQGVRPGQFVGVPTIRSVDTLVTILAIWAIGAAYCPIDPVEAPPEHIASILDAVANMDAGPPHAGIPAVHLPTRTTAGAESTGDLTARPVPDTVPAYLMATSGSSGAPKTTVVTRGGLRAVFESLYTALADHFPEGARWTQLHPLTFGYSVCELLGSLVFGGRLVLVPREEPLTLSHLTAKINVGTGPHVVCLTPSELAVLVDRVRSAGGRLPSHIVLSGEAAYKAPLAEIFSLDQTHPPVVVNTYAATETSGQITAHVITPATLDAVADGYVGVPLPEVDVVLRRPDGQPIPRTDTSTVGQIYVGGPTLAAGYLDPAQTRQRFIMPPGHNEIQYRTGDLGQWSNLGGLRVVGRADRMAKLGGRWFGMEQIERLVAESDQVSEVVAFAGALGDQGPDCLCLNVVPDTRKHRYAARLRDDVVRRLPVRTTVRLTMTDRIPRLPNGKVDMALLARQAAAPPSSGLPAQHARAVARVVRAEWTALLGAGVATDKNLFELGVDSLGTIAAAARLSSALDIPVSPELLLNNPRIDLQIAHLTALITRRNSKSIGWEELKHMAPYVRTAEATQKGSK